MSRRQVVYFLLFLTVGLIFSFILYKYREIHGEVEEKLRTIRGNKTKENFTTVIDAQPNTILMPDTRRPMIMRDENSRTNLLPDREEITNAMNKQPISLKVDSEYRSGFFNCSRGRVIGMDKIRMINNISIFNDAVSARHNITLFIECFRKQYGMCHLKTEHTRSTGILKGTGRNITVQLQVFLVKIADKCRYNIEQLWIEDSEEGNEKIRQQNKKLEEKSLTDFMKENFGTIMENIKRSPKKGVPSEDTADWCEQLLLTGQKWLAN